VTKVFGFVVAASVLGGFIAGAVGAFIFTAQGHDLRSERQTRHFTRVIADPIAAVATVVAGATMLIASRALPREVLSDGSAVGAAWNVGTVKEIAQGLGVGGFVGLAVAILVEHQAKHHAYGLVKTVAAVAIAPPVEEMLYRGLLYGGYRRSLGPVWAAVVTTLLFCVPHVPRSVLAGFGITAMATAALWLRLRSASVGPAVAVHMGYNAAVVAIFFFYAR
jgi:membrane protease YdiL (CAAX protease family)